MALLNWSDDLKSGVDALDFEHERLVALINELHEDLVRDLGKETVRPLLTTILRRVQSSFALEEKIMKGLQCPDLDEHCLEHAKLLDALTEVLEVHAKDRDLDYAQTVQDMLLQWAMVHLRKRDTHIEPPPGGKSLWDGTIFGGLT